MSGVEPLPVQYSDTERANERLENGHVVKRTPIERNTSFGDLVGADAYLEMEHLQWTGSFKTRDAYNKIRQDTDRGINEFVAVNAGNRTQGVVLMATECGADSTVAIPENAPQAKIDATRDHSAEVELVGGDFQGTMAYAQSLTEESDAESIRAYDDCDIVVGQGTLGVGIHRDPPEVGTVAVPVDDGGLISGITTAVKHYDPGIHVVGIQAKGAETVHGSLDKGVSVTLDDTNTIADGTATSGIPESMLRTVKEHVDEIVTVSDGEIAEAILSLPGRAKQVIKGAGAASVTAILSDDLGVESEAVMPLLCGGNLDVTTLQAALVHTLTSRHQTFRLRVRIWDEPGEVARLSRLIVDRDASIHGAYHIHAVDALNVGEAHLLFRIRTKGAEHAATVMDTIEDTGYTVDNVPESG